MDFPAFDVIRVFDYDPDLLDGLDGCTGSRDVAGGRAELHDLRLHRRAARWGRPELAPRGTPLDTSLQPWTEDVSLAAWLGDWA